MRASAMFPTRRKHSEGFTLLELVIGIVVFTISLTIVLSLIVPQAEQTAEPFRQVKAAKLGQSLMNDILSRSYDENSDRSPPFVTCVDKPDPSNANDNLCSDALGPDAGETSEEAYDDVDDYNGYVISNVGGNYNGFAYKVDVTYDSSIDVTSDPQAVVYCPDPEEAINACVVPENKQYKRIDIALTAPDGQVYSFSAYRGSY